MEANGQACTMYGMDEKYIQNFNKKRLKLVNHMGDFSIN
jgi:hypothetical protein